MDKNAPRILANAFKAFVASLLAVSLAFFPAYGEVVQDSAGSSLGGEVSGGEADPGCEAPLSEPSASQNPDDMPSSELSASIQDEGVLLPSAEGDPAPAADEQPEPAKVQYRFTFPKTPAIASVEQNSSGLLLTWSYIPSADGYIIFCRENDVNGQGDKAYREGLSGRTLTIDPALLKASTIAMAGWVRMTTITANTTISWTDSSQVSGLVCEYVVIAYKNTSDPTLNNFEINSYLPTFAKGRSLSLPSETVQAYQVKRPQIASAARTSGSTMSVSWTQVPNASGYQVQYCSNSFFRGASTVTLQGEASTSTTISGLSPSNKCYVRVRAFKYFGGTTKYSPWEASAAAKATKYASRSKLTYKYKVKKKVTVKVKKKGKKPVTKKVTKKVVRYKVLEIKARAGQRNGGYDTVQGGCSDGKYMYFVLLNKFKNRCKIAKIKISTRKKVKVSKALKLNHGNGMTYNSRNGKLYVAHGEGNRRAISEVDASTLKKTRSITLSNPTTLVGATASQISSIIGTGSISYSPEYDMYVCMLTNSHDLVYLDSNFKMVRYVPLSKKNRQVYQGLCVAGDMVYVAESFGSGSGKKYNIVSAYNMDGEFVCTTRIQKAYELENIFFAGNKLYAGFYRSYTKNRKWTKDNYVYALKSF